MTTSIAAISRAYIPDAELRDIPSHPLDNKFPRGHARELKNFSKMDYCIFEEAGLGNFFELQALLMLAPEKTRVILVGDHKQLPDLSTIKNSFFFNISPLKIAANIYSSKVSESLFHQLTECYRLPPINCTLVNEITYQMTMRCRWVYSAEKYVFFTSMNYPQLKCVDLAQTEEIRENKSFFNLGEVNLVIKQLILLCLKAERVGNVVKIKNPFTIVIISAYQGQLEKLSSLIDGNLIQRLGLANFVLEIHTIDSFQGNEADFIFICTTRTNQIGFLNSLERINVALSRTKLCNTVFVCSELLQSVPHWALLFSYSVYYNPLLPKITELNELLMKSDKSVKFREDVAVVEEITTQESENIEKEEETDEHDILGMSTAHPQREVEFKPRVSIPPTIPYITPQMELSRAKNTTLHSVINTWTRKSKEPNLFEKVEYREKCAKRNQLVIKDMRVKIEEWSSEIVYVDTVQHIKIYNFNDYFSISENEEFKVSIKKHQKNQYTVKLRIRT
ncbi:hypothetical protein RCL1_005434 [Eukaryota sp. TZLM3-RCL]